MLVVPVEPPLTVVVGELVPEAGVGEDVNDDVGAEYVGEVEAGKA